MKRSRTICTLVVLLALALLSSTARADDTTCETGYSYSAFISAGATRTFKFWESRKALPVFTLKNDSAASDFDIYVHGDSARLRLIAKGIRGGTKTELLTPSRGESGYLYITVKNDGSEWARYRLYCHEVDFEQIGKRVLVETAAQAFLEWLVTDDSSTTEQQRDASRGAALAMSVLQNKDLASVGKDMAINELTMRLRQELGYGFGGDLAVNFGIAVVRDVFRYY
jgi:hypothetical protein